MKCRRVDFATYFDCCDIFGALGDHIWVVGCREEVFLMVIFGARFWIGWVVGVGTDKIP